MSSDNNLGYPSTAADGIPQVLPGTVILPYAGDCKVLLKDVACTGQSAKEGLTALASVDVSLQLANPESTDLLSSLYCRRLRELTAAIQARKH